MGVVEPSAKYPQILQRNLQSRNVRRVRFLSAQELQVLAILPRFPVRPCFFFEAGSLGSELGIPFECEPVVAKLWSLGDKVWDVTTGEVTGFAPRLGEAASFYRWWRRDEVNVVEASSPEPHRLP